MTKTQVILNQKKVGRFVGFAKNVGNVMCALILTEDTHELLPRACLHAADESAIKNKCAYLDSIDGDVESKDNTPIVIKSLTDQQQAKLKELDHNC